MRFGIIAVLSKIVKIATPCRSTKFYSTVCDTMSNPSVTISQGTLKGSQLSLLDGTPYYSFKGIPYAEIPARFVAPQPPKPWQGVYNATEHGPVCPQYDMTVRQIVEGDENCLYLNVYTKSLSKNSKLPVMVFIHGGAFMSGSGNDGLLGPEWLIQHDVILVTINYRLEVLGFLCLDTPEVPGNAGMKDQVAALHWVQNNIAQFGGDPNNVTLFGESAGASSVTYHMQSPMSKGLFHKAIAQSGTSIVDWAQGKDGKDRAFRAANNLGENSSSTDDVLKFFRLLPATKLAKLTYPTRTKDERHRGLPIHFAPVVEKKFEGVEPFITEDAVDALVARKTTNVPLMLGYNSDEALFMLENAMNKHDFSDENLKYLVPREIAKNLSENVQLALGQRIKNFYIGDRSFTKEDAKAIDDLLTDIHFTYSVHRYANFYCSIDKTYLYKFSCDTDLNVVKGMSPFAEMSGAGHADDLFYLFSNVLNKSIYEENKNLQDLVFRITKLWTDFAKTGNPTPDDFHRVKWSPYTASNRKYFEINEIFADGQNADRARVEFWNKLYSKAGLPCIPKSNL